MIIEGLGKVSFINGLLKVQTIAVNASGEAYESGQIEIPGNRVGEVINGLTQAAANIDEKLNENASVSEDESNKSKKDTKTKKNGKKSK